MRLIKFRLKEYTIPGAYEANLTRIYIYSPEKKTNRVTIICKGLFGTFDSYDESGVNMLGEKLLENNISHVVYYNSSRKFDTSIDDTQEKRMHAFIDKTFTEEFQDLIHVVNDLLEKQEYFSDLDIEFYVHGSSLGGTLAILLADKFKQVSRLSLSAPAINKGKSMKSIIMTMPDTSKILTAISKFKGRLLVLHGSKDDVVPETSSVSVTKNAKKAQVIFKIIDGANHNFSRLHNIKSNNIKRIFTNTIFDFLC